MDIPLDVGLSAGVGGVDVPAGEWPLGRFCRFSVEKRVSKCLNMIDSIYITIPCGTASGAFRSAIKMFKFSIASSIALKITR